MVGRREEAERSLRQIYRDAELAIRDATIELDGDLRVVRAIKVDSFLPVEPETLIGQPLPPEGWGLVGEDGSPIDKSEHPAAEALESGQSVVGVVGYVPPGETEPVMLRHGAHRVSDGDVAVDIVLSGATTRAQNRDEIERQDTRFRILADTVPVAIYEATPAGEVTFANRRFTELTGYAVGEIPDLPMLEIVHPDDLAAIEASTAEAIESGVYVSRYRVVNRHDQSVRWVTSRLKPSVGDGGKVIGYVGSLEDVDELHVAERDAKRLADIVESTSDSVVAFDDQLRLVYANRAALALMNRTDPATRSKTGHVFGPQLVEQLSDHVGSLLMTTGTWKGELELVDAAGLPIHVSVIAMTQRDADGNVDRYVLVGRDIDDTKRREADLEHEAHHDALTGLPNRLKLLAHIRREPATTQISAAFFVDVDRFKRVNDEFGHRVGDLVLKAVAARLTASIRDSDLLVRLGGDEFTVWAERAGTPDEVAAMAQRLIDAVAADPVSVEPGGVEVPLTVSVGVAVGENESAEALIHRADSAMYRAKDLGRNRWHISSAADT